MQNHGYTGSSSIAVEKNPLRKHVIIIHKLTSRIDKMIHLIGKLVSFLTIIMILVVLVIVVSRYFLKTGSIALQESLTYLHAVTFLAGIAFTLKDDGHVRVDIFYRHFSRRRQALINICGSLLFLFPLCFLIIYCSWDYVLASWVIAETSAENNGLPYVYLLKSLLIVMPIMLLIQGVSEVLKDFLTLLNSPSSMDKSNLRNTEHEEYVAK